MDLIKLVNVSKRYELGSGRYFTALQNINLTLPSSGFISIVGKSGCGKSTLLNIIGMMDESSSGYYYFNNKNVSKLSHLDKEYYLNTKIGIVFQHYNLIEDQDVLFNIALPMLIGGESYKAAIEDAKVLLKGIDFNESLYHKKVSSLSGGEKQRVAILRSLINSPNILLCDEPTGALDSENSIMIMNILKKTSKNKLVVVVSHNEELVKEYSDRIITLKDGKIEKDELINDSTNKGTPILKDISTSKKQKWIERISLHNFKKRIKYNFFSIISLSFSLIAMVLVAGFARYSNEAILKETKKRIDYGVLTISKEEKTDLEGSIVSLVQQSRPSSSTLTNLKDNNNQFTFLNNYDILLPSNSKMTLNEVKLDQLTIRPIYSFSHPSFNPGLLIKGDNPSEDSFVEVIVNKQAYQYILDTAKKEVIGNTILLENDYESEYYGFDGENHTIRDVFSLSKNLKIVGVVDELDFLATPTVYYSYNSFVKYLETYLLNNLSLYLGKDLSWKERIDTCSDNDDLSSYSIRAFLNDYRDSDKLNEYIKELNNDGLSATSLGLTVENSLVDLVKASTTGMELFLAIAIIGIVLILGIISYSSFSQDRKRSAIFSALGASRSSIIKIFLLENMFIGLFSFLLTVILSFPLTLLVNYIVTNITGLSNLVRTPYYLFTGFKYDYLLVLFISVSVIILLSTIIPIIFSKKISISKELRDE